MFLRGYNMEKRIDFGWDQERDAYQVKTMLETKKPTLIGPRVLGPEGFFLGPYYTYLITPFFLLTKFHPFAYVYLLWIYNILFFIAAKYVLSKVFSPTVSFFFLLWWGINPALIGFDMGAWNPLFLPLGFMLLLGELHKISKKITWLHVLKIGLLNGLLFHFHVQSLFITLFTLVFLLYTYGFSFIKKYLIIFILAYASTFLPLVFFDLRHDFLNIKLLLHFLSSSTSTPLTHENQLYPVLQNVFEYFLPYHHSFFPLLFYIITLFCSLFIINKQKKARNYFIPFTSVWILFPILFSLYSQRPSEYYFLFLFPFIFLIIINFFVLTKKTFLLIFISTLLIYIYYPTYSQILSPAQISLYTKDKLVLKLAQLIKNKKCNVTINAPMGRDTGFKFLIDYYGIKQTRNFNDPLAEIDIPAQKNDYIIGSMGIKIPPDLK